MKNQHIFDLTNHILAKTTRKINQIPDKELGETSFFIKSHNNIKYAQHVISNDLTVSQVDIDNFTLCVSGSRLNFFSEFARHSKSELVHHFEQIENDFNLKSSKQDSQKIEKSIPKFKHTKKNQEIGEDYLSTTPDLGICLSLPNEPGIKFFKVVPHFQKMYEFDYASKKMKYTHSLHSHNYLYIPGGFDNIKKIFQICPMFFHDLFSYLETTQYATVSRLDWKSDYSIEIMNRLTECIFANRYDSFGKHITAFPKDRWDSNILQISENISAVTKTKQKGISIGRSSSLRDNLSLADKQRISSLYIGNYKRSHVNVHIYTKDDQYFAKKNKFSLAKSRIEIREYNKSRPKTIFDSYRNIAPEMPHDLAFYKAIFEDYNSDASIGLRSLLFLDAILNNFTLISNSKTKTRLTAYYYDALLAGHDFFCSKYVFQNQEFQKKFTQNINKLEKILIKQEKTLKKAAKIKK